ncbi:MAG: glycosyltransferase, partial [Methanomicrobiaceae archaeon]|nr:glycosyltransferase [Methanomicrobiaceae archaeon]
LLVQKLDDKYAVLAGGRRHAALKELIADKASKGFTAKTKVDCRLVLCGSMASDDPESTAIQKRISRLVNGSKYKDDIVLISSENNIMVNALQRTSDVVIQRSIREGFGLTVSEALWKGTPVVASEVGGIPLQITDGYSGYLEDPDDTGAFVERVVELLGDPDLAAKMGSRGREHVAEHFLLPRLISDYLDLINETVT